MLKKLRKIFRKTRISLLLGVFGGLLGIGACIVFLIFHLMSIQVPERLRYIRDYQDFTLSVAEIPDCTDEFVSLFQYKNEIYNGICIREVYVNYGRVKAPLQMVLENEYIKLDDIKKKLGVIQKDISEEVINPTLYYEYRRSEEEDGNYLVTISPREYHNSNFTEITFEKYKEFSSEVSVQGSLEMGS